MKEEEAFLALLEKFNKLVKVFRESAPQPSAYKEFQEIFERNLTKSWQVAFALADLADAFSQYLRDQADSVMEMP